MVLVAPVLVALAVGLLLGGSFERLARLRLRRIELVVAAFVLQVIAFPFTWLPWTTSGLLPVVLWLVSFSLLAVAAWANRRVPGVLVIAVGMASNVAAIVVNGGYMPVLPSALRGAGESYDVSNNSAAEASPHLGWLVDRWAVPDWMPTGNVFSVGDVLIAMGVIVLVWSAMGVRLPGRGFRGRTLDAGRPGA
jgi:hypothetical protein